VEEILAFSRAGNRRPNLLPVNLKDILHQAIAREGGSLEIQLQIPDGLVVQADAALLGRAVGNLLRNASIHAGVTAHVTLVATEEEEHCTLTVADDGPGVAEHELARLFEPFYRPDRSRSRETGGSGLGLAIVRTAIEACQGEVSAHLPASGGFSVTIRLLKSPC
jgi:two-component system sensor histidine kinase CpxA